MAAADWPKLSIPYLLCLNVKHYRDASGVRYLDPLWFKDLTQHARYLENLTLASPCDIGNRPLDAIPWAPSRTDIRFIDLPCPSSVSRAILHLPATTALLWRAVGLADIVHTGVAGWPIPLGWVVAPMAAVRGKRLVIVIESAPWRLRPGLPVSWRKNLRAAVAERLSRWCVNFAKLVIVTQDEYRNTLLSDPGRGHIIHASWVDEDTILSAEEAAESWREKASPAEPLKLVFAGRLQHSKGILLILDAMRQLSRRGLPVQLEILGEGELAGVCEQACQSLNGEARATMRGLVPYGSEFFRALRRHHALVVPSLSDEQPRVVYDAYSQAVPVLANDTPGLRDCVRHGKTGMFVSSNEPASWVSLIERLHGGRDQLQAMGLAGVELARRMTHQEMHRQRWRLLHALLSAGPTESTTA